MMRFLPHALFGIFSGLVAYMITGNSVAFWVFFFVQIGLILDFINKKLGTREWLHTIMAMLIVSSVTYVTFKPYWTYVFLAYFSHLFLDIFVDEDIPLLWPFTYKLMYPMKYSENIVIWGSVIGSIVLGIYLFL